MKTKATFKAYEAGGRSKVVFCETKAAVAKAITDRYDEINKDKPISRKLRVIIAAHGYNEVEMGPLVGEGDDTTRLFDNDVLKDYETDADLQAYITDTFATSEMAKTKGKIDSLFFTSCKGVSSDGGKKFYSALQGALGASSITVGTKYNRLVWQWSKEQNSLYAVLYAYDAEPVRPGDKLKVTDKKTPETEVLYVAKSP